jgi:hypothetical protein
MKKNIFLIITILILIFIELYLTFYLNSESETFVTTYELKDFVFIGIFLSLIFTEKKKIGLLFIAFYQIVFAGIYSSHLPGTGNLILVIIHLIAAPLIFFNDWIEEKLNTRFKKRINP